MISIEQQYLNLMGEILNYGEPHADRTGVGTRSVFGRQIRHNFIDGFPLLTTKKMAMRNPFRELMWFISGSTNVNDLPEQVHPWWKPWADANGDLGPIYGKQLRDHHGTDQLDEILDQIANDHNSRRIIMSTWSASETKQMRLPPCHGLVIQFKVHDNKEISLSMYQRSADIFLGVPVNIASYALLLQMVCAVTGKTARDLVMTFGDIHLYDNHHDAAMTQLSRQSYPFPHLVLSLPDGETPLQRLENFTWGHVTFDDYMCHPPIPAPLAV